MMKKLALKPKLKPKIILAWLMSVWMIFSIGYIGNDLWNQYKNRQLRQAYEQGVQETIEALITASEECKPVPIFSGDKKVNLIKSDCPAASRK